jgi:hypothetical protein
VEELDRYPKLTELLNRGGVPGVKYLYALSANISKFQDLKGEDGEPLGWMLTRDVPAFNVKGQSMVLMSMGEPINGARPESWTPECYMDKEADKLTGLGPREASDGGVEPRKAAGPKDKAQPENRQGQTG